LDAIYLFIYFIFIFIFLINRLMVLKCILSFIFLECGLKYVVYEHTIVIPVCIQIYNTSIIRFFFFSVN